MKAVIFDLDGTLVDSEPNYFEAERRLLADHGIVDFTTEMKRQYVGMSTMEMLEDLRTKHGIEESAAALAARKNGYYLALAERDTPVFPEMRELLDLLNRRHYRMGVASGSSPEVIDTVLAVARLRQYFDAVVSADSVEKGKPAPDLFLEVARRLRTPPEQCLVVEDSRYGVEAAKRAGMRCIAIPYLTDEPLAEAFRAADLIFEEGMRAFSAHHAFAWIEQAGLADSRPIASGRPGRS